MGKWLRKNWKLSKMVVINLKYYDISYNLLFLRSIIINDILISLHFGRLTTFLCYNSLNLGLLLFLFLFLGFLLLRVRVDKSNNLLMFHLVQSQFFLLLIQDQFLSFQFLLKIFSLSFQSPHPLVSFFFNL